MTSPLIIQLAVGSMMNFAYLVVDPGSKACAVVDPGWDTEAIVAAADKAGCHVEKILLTHTHYDHARQAPALAKRTGAGVWVHEAEAGKLPAGLTVHPTEEGTVIPLGGLQIRCLHTPGHTPGSQCFLAGEALLTGDTLFVDECGRDDLPGGDPRKLVQSLRRLGQLDPAITVYPGHHYGPTKTSTIGAQRQTNPHVREALRVGP